MLKTGPKSYPNKQEIGLSITIPIFFPTAIQLGSMAWGNTEFYPEKKIPS